MCCEDLLYMKTTVKEVLLNPNYLIGQSNDKVDFCDVFQLKTTKFKEQIKPKDLMIAFFLSFPKSFTFLLHTRDRIASFFELKTAPKVERQNRLTLLRSFEGNIGDNIAIFEVLNKNQQELLTGQTDSHLDFKLSFISKKEESISTFELATTVCINNHLGKIYFAIVKPFHKFYLKKILRKMEETLLQKDW